MVGVHIDSTREPGGVGHDGYPGSVDDATGGQRASVIHRGNEGGEDEGADDSRRDRQLVRKVWQQQIDGDYA